MLAGSALMAAATLVSWMALVSVAGLRAAGLAVSPVLQVACGGIALPIALAATVRTAISAWRGPRVIAFERDDALRLAPLDAGAIRTGAQLRGTMGGAGHVYPGRLVFPTIAWLAAVASGAQIVDDRAMVVAGSWPLAIALSAIFVSVLFPARPFWYREVTGGGVLVSPRAAALVLSRSAVADTGDPDGERHEGA